ncbi:MAG: ABC transporter ATP-binding protein/permease [Clostridiales bacterium]|nr:ABC transporter ATP-binding protein/permease [Clostridiales bacterium]
MLQLKNISKKYVTGDLTQQALDDVSLNFRDNEFVAILGPSGSGKTTLLNIIGGLDRYDTGDLIINGISTKKYSDRDWDSYRNHTIGFVFQSYNLIPHQTVLANVELALTISGVSKSERRERAKAALEQVGLGDQLHKRPNQMSGGQMQRVAIARALINNPDILLADEPTGALDTSTSVQVMDLLKEVAKDRMVIMVTHNPELAQQYATRIVRLQDGHITGDSDPFIVDETALEPARHENMGHSSMSFGTSMGLSINNLLTKRGRTFLTAFAGSIGIIGIALVLSVSSGVNDYIDDLEESTMSDYPIQISSSGFDMTSMMTTVIGMRNSDEEEDDDSANVISVMEMITSMFSSLDSNDLESFKSYIESGESDIYDYTKAIEYIYDTEPQIYLEQDDNVYQVNPESTLTSGFGLSSTLMGMMSSYMSISSFYEMPENEELYINDYDLKAGHWPENYNECVLVLTSNGGIGDYMMYTLGLADYEEYVDMVDEAANGEDVEPEEYLDKYDYDDILNVSFKLINASDCYEYDDEYGVWTDKTDNESFMKSLVKNGEDIHIVGIVQPKEDASASALSEGINYPPSLIEHIAQVAATSDIVKDQLANPKTNVFTGEPFGDEANFDLTSLFDLDEDTLKDIFGDMDLEDMFGSFDLDSLDLGSVDLSGMNLSGIDMSNVDMSNIDLSSLLGSLDLSSLIDPSSLDLTQIAQSLLSGYQSYTEANSLSTYEDLLEDFSSYINGDGQAVISSVMSQIIQDSVAGSIDRSAVSDLMQEIQADPDNADSIFSTWMAGQLSSVTISSDQIATLATTIASGYYSTASGKSMVDSVSQGLTDYFSSSAASSVITSAMMSTLDTSALESAVASAMSSYMSSLGASISGQIESAMSSVVSQISSSIESAMSSAFDNISDDFLDNLDIDMDSIMDSVSTNMDEDALLELMTSMSMASSTTYDSNLASLGYVDFDNPTEIDIYPRDFESKDYVVDILDDYNAQMEAADQIEKQITYTDLVGTMLSTVTTIINMVSYVLIAFISVSLIVSSIMIGIITYISVLERTREIGILRAIGASKRNISAIFNAETFIVGLIAGIMGVVIALILLVPINMVVHNYVQADNARAYLPYYYGLLLIALSVVLTFIGGLIPSAKASHMDPVSALRSE